MKTWLSRATRWQPVWFETDTPETKSHLYRLIQKKVACHGLRCDLSSLKVDHLFNKNPFTMGDPDYLAAMMVALMDGTSAPAYPQKQRDLPETNEHSEVYYIPDNFEGRLPRAPEWCSPFDYYAELFGNRERLFAYLQRTDFNEVHFEVYMHLSEPPPGIDTNDFWRLKEQERIAQELGMTCIELREHVLANYPTKGTVETYALPNIDVPEMSS